VWIEKKKKGKEEKKTAKENVWPGAKPDVGGTSGLKSARRKEGNLASAMGGKKKRKAEGKRKRRKKIQKNDRRGLFLPLRATSIARWLRSRISRR